MINSWEWSLHWRGSDGYKGLETIGSSLPLSGCEVARSLLQSANSLTLDFLTSRTAVNKSLSLINYPACSIVLENHTLRQPITISSLSEEYCQIFDTVLLRGRLHFFTPEQKVSCVTYFFQAWPNIYALLRMLIKWGSKHAAPMKWFILEETQSDFASGDTNGAWVAMQVQLESRGWHRNPNLASSVLIYKA